MGCVGSGGEVDHGELSGGAHREEQEQRAAPQLCVGRSDGAIRQEAAPCPIT